MIRCEQVNRWHQLEDLKQKPKEISLEAGIKTEVEYLGVYINSILKRFLFHIISNSENEPEF